MADRQGFENNDFTGGLSDEYVPSKDNRLDAAENICLDDDLTPIQRPGSAKLTGANTSFGKHVDQDIIKGLQENSKDLYSFTESKAFSYNKTTQTAFSFVEPDSGTITTPLADPHNFNEAVSYTSDPSLISFPAVAIPTPTTDGAVNSFQMRDVVYATHNDPSFVQKFFTEDDKGSLGIGVGIPRPVDQFTKNAYGFQKRARNEVSLWRVQATYPSPSPAQDAINRTPYLMPMNPSAPVFPDLPGVPRSTDTYGWSDKPYTYKQDALGNISIIKGGTAVPQWTYKYQFLYVLKITYKIDGVTYVKRSAPSLPMWFLSDFELKQTSTGSPPTSGSTTNYYVGVVYSIQEINTMLRAMNLPFYEEGYFEIEPYMTDSDGATFTSRKTYDINGAPTVNSVAVDITDFYTRINNNQPADPISNLYVGVAGSTNDNQYQPDFYIQHERSPADEDYVSLYTEGGILAYDPPPPSKYIFGAGTYAFYLNVKELTVKTDDPLGTVEYNFLQVPYRGKISNANDPDSVPEGNFFDLPHEITGGGAVLDRAIVGTTKEIYRIDGRYNADGSGLVNGQLLSSETGLLSHKSVVTVKDKLFFCGDDGIYATDGVAVICISKHISRTYRQLIDAVASDSSGEYISIDRDLAQEKISAVYDRIFDRILFSFGNYVLALELKASAIDEAHGAFYGPWFTGMNKAAAPEAFTALGLYNDMVVRGDEFGYVYQMSPGYLADPKTSVASPTTWGLSPVLYRLRTAKIAFGSLVVKKWVNLITFILKRKKVISGGETDIDVQVNAYNDGERVRQVLKPAHYLGNRDNIFDEDPKSGGTSVPFDATNTLVNFQRRFGSSGLRCITKSIEFTNGLHLVAKSDDYQNAVTNLTFASLPGYPTYQWPKEAQDLNQIGYAISFDVDDYQAKYMVTAATAATLTLSSAPPAGVHKWKLYSYSTDQFFGLHSVGLVYTTFGSKHSAYQIDQQGGNSGDVGE